MWQTTTNKEYRQFVDTDIAQLTLNQLGIIDVQGEIIRMHYLSKVRYQMKNRFNSMHPLNSNKILRNKLTNLFIKYWYEKCRFECSSKLASAASIVTCEIRIRDY